MYIDRLSEALEDVYLRCTLHNTTAYISGWDTTIFIVGPVKQYIILMTVLRCQQINYLYMPILPDFSKIEHLMISTSFVLSQHLIRSTFWLLNIPA